MINQSINRLFMMVNVIAVVSGSDDDNDDDNADVNVYNIQIHTYLNSLLVRMMFGNFRTEVFEVSIF